MFVDFTDLNKACPKDSYPFPSIDALVDSASDCKLLNFLDAFSVYNQIKMHPRDECKTAFMTELSCYYYTVMPFGLKNAGATYQRLMDRVLAPRIGRNVQAYVDDMVVTSQEKDQHVADLEELFTTIAKYRLKLNPEKCVFGVEAGKFLGFLLTEHGIEANPEMCAAILAMRSPDGDQDQKNVEANQQDQEEVEAQIEDAHGGQSPPQRLTRSMFKSLGINLRKLYSNFE